MNRYRKDPIGDNLHMDIQHLFDMAPPAMLECIEEIFSPFIHPIKAFIVKKLQQLTKSKYAQCIWESLEMDRFPGICTIQFNFIEWYKMQQETKLHHDNWCAELFAIISVEGVRQ